MIKAFSVGEVVWYISHENHINKSKVERIIPSGYILRGYNFPVGKGRVFSTHEQAQDYLNQK